MTAAFSSRSATLSRRAAVGANSHGVNPGSCKSGSPVFGDGSRDDVSEPLLLRR
jgi:hypothetical protein